MPLAFCYSWSETHICHTRLANKEPQFIGQNLILDIRFKRSMNVSCDSTTSKESKQHSISLEGSTERAKKVLKLSSGKKLLTASFQCLFRLGLKITQDTSTLSRVRLGQTTHEHF